MADIHVIHAVPRTVDEELPAHQRTFHSFNKLVLFAILHIVLVLACLALAFPGHTPVLAAIIGVGGTLALIAAFAITASTRQSSVTR